MRYCWRVGLLAYPPSVLQPELESKVQRLRSIMVIILSAMAWVSADVGTGGLSTEAPRWGVYERRLGRDKQVYRLDWIMRFTEEPLSGLRT